MNDNIEINIGTINIPGGADGTEPSVSATQNMDLSAARQLSAGSPLYRLMHDYGYEMTQDEPYFQQLISDFVTADDKGLNVRWQRVLTIRKDANNGERWTVLFSHNRVTKFHMFVYGGIGMARAIAFEALLAWHRHARTKPMNVELAAAK